MRCGSSGTRWWRKARRSRRIDASPKTSGGSKRANAKRLRRSRREDAAERRASGPAAKAAGGTRAVSCSARAYFPSLILFSSDAAVMPRCSAIFWYGPDSPNLSMPTTSVESSDEALPAERDSRLEHDLLRPRRNERALELHGLRGEELAGDHGHDADLAVREGGRSLQRHGHLRACGDDHHVRGSRAVLRDVGAAA